MKYFLIAFFFIFCNNCFAQMRWGGAAFLQDANGNWVDPKPTYKTEGSPFFMDNYLPARLTLGSKAYIVQAKLNLADNTIHFDVDGNEMVSAKPVNKVEFMHPGKENNKLVFKIGFPAIGKNTEQSYYQVLDSGKATLLKHIRINRRETVPYNSATRYTIFEKDDNYYIFQGNKMLPVKKVSDLYEAMKDEKEKIKSFVSSNKTKTTNEQDLIAVIAFYNRL